MPSLKTNYIRTDITSQCFRYEFELLSHQPVDHKYHHEVEGYFLSLNPFVVFSHPFVYSTEEIPQLKSFNFMLSNGQKIHVSILLNNTITLNSKQVAADIHRQLMKGTNFLYSQGLGICLNPFDQKKVNHSTSLMPGFSVSTESSPNCIGFYLIPIEAKITQFHSLSALHDHSIVLDYNSGSFYQKLSIVRYDKQNQLIHFRTGEQIKKEYLKSLEIMPLNGFQLAFRLSAYFKRLRQSQKLKKFIQKWQLKFDSRFMQLPYNFFPVGHIILGNKEQKSLGECIGSVNAYNFQHNFRKLLSASTFDQNMRATVYFLLPQIYVPPTSEDVEIDSEPLMDFYVQLVTEEQEFVMQIVNQMQIIKERMKLQDCNLVVLKYDVFVGWVNSLAKTIKQIHQIVEKQSASNNGDKIFVLTNFEQLIREEREIQLGAKFLPDADNTKPFYKAISSYFVENGVYYHMINAKDNDFRKQADVMALKTLATIQCKLRLNPWKIKDIPFGTKPLMTVSIHVKQQTNGAVTINAVGSLNAFLSKYTCLTATSAFQGYQTGILNAITQTLARFNSIHKIYPKRIMIFRTGDFVQDCYNQFTIIQQCLTQSYACKPTYILLSQESPLRVYNQIDYNYISKDTVKPTQMLCQIKYNNERFLQLQTDSPMHRINVIGIDEQQVNFEEKVIELTTKLCFTYQLMSEMKYGKGLGFVGYAEKLYQWSKEYPSVKGMEGHLRDGLLMFL